MGMPYTDAHHVRELRERAQWSPPGDEDDRIAWTPQRDVTRLRVEELLGQTTGHERAHRRRVPVIINGEVIKETLKQRLTRELDELETAVTLLAGQMARRTRQLEHLKRFPETDPFEDGTVLQFDKTFPHSPDVPYSYVAHRADGHWYVTGARSPQRATWDQFVNWLGLGVEVVYQLNPGGRVGRKKVIG